jgi:GTP cyclohydrolase I
MKNIINKSNYQALPLKEQALYIYSPNIDKYILQDYVEPDKETFLMPARQDAVQAMETVIMYLCKGKPDSHTEGTAERFIKAWDNDWGVGYEDEIKFTTFKDDGTDQMVVEMDIPVVSHCSHHLAPIIGICHIAYLPSDKIVGLSKLNRIVEKFARRLQVQERLTTQIADELQKLLEPRGVGVQVIAEHMCVSTRGVRHHRAKTVTTKLTGLFLKENSVKAEFLGTINTHGRK